MPTDIAVWRSLHVFGAALWLGMMTYHVFVFLPAMQGAGKAAGPVTKQLVDQGRLTRILLAVSSLTVLAGLMLYARMEAYTREMMTAYGISLNLAVVLGLGAYGVGLFVQMPAAKRLKALAAKDMGTTGMMLQDRMRKGAHIVFGLLMVAFVLMSLGTRW